MLGDICFEFYALYYLSLILLSVVYCAFISSLLSNFKIKLFQHKKMGMMGNTHQSICHFKLKHYSGEILQGDLSMQPLELWPGKADTCLTFYLHVVHHHNTEIRVRKSTIESHGGQERQCAPKDGFSASSDSEVFSEQHVG